MSEHGVRATGREMTVSAPAAEVYRLLADAERWPQIFPATVFVERGERSAAEERVRFWALVGGTASTWTSHRRLQAEALRIDFWQERTAPDIAAMSGSWVVVPAGPRRCRVRLLHHYRATDDDPRVIARIDRVVREDGRAQLAALATEAEHSTTRGRTFSFTDTVRIDAAATDVYAFLHEAGRWAQRLPHICSARVQENSPGLQTLEMDMLGHDDSAHRTNAIRVCFPHHRIVYKQTAPGGLMAAHTGYAELEEHDDGVSVTAEHTVVLNTGSIPAILGADAGIEQAGDFVRGVLRGNSRTTLDEVKKHAERRQQRAELR